MFNFVRRIDDLGRIVIPKELRKELNICEGDELKMSLKNGIIQVGKMDISMAEMEAKALNVISARTRDM